MFEEIQENIKNCDDCNRHARPNHREEGNPILVEKLFDRWQLDFIGPLKKTARQNCYILVAVECLTRWPEAIAVRAAMADAVEKFLKDHLIPRFGCPRHIQTDNGTHFRNRAIAQLTEDWHIQHHFSTPYHPQSNGMVERYNKTLAEAIKRSCHGENWDLQINNCLTAYRAKEHSVTKMSPAKSLYGEEMTLPIEV